MNGPGEAMVELAEKMVDTVAHADWVQFQKNGTDATTACVTIARAATKRRKVMVARGAYHGAVPWCSPSLVGVTSEDRAHIIQFDYNDVASLQAAAEEAGDDLAGIIVSAVPPRFRPRSGTTGRRHLRGAPARSIARSGRGGVDRR